MNGYTASARIDRVPVRARRVPQSPTTSAGVGDRWTDYPVATRTLTERLEDWRVVWAQTTFYLFDPESWR